MKAPMTMHTVITVGGVWLACSLGLGLFMGGVFRLGRRVASVAR